MRLRLPLRRTTRLWRQLWHLLSQAAVLHPMRGRGGGVVDVPGRPQAIAELDTLQRYLLGVSHSDKAQMSLLSVEQFIERTMHYATNYMHSFLAPQ